MSSAWVTSKNSFAKNARRSIFQCSALGVSWLIRHSSRNRHEPSIGYPVGHIAGSVEPSRDYSLATGIECDPNEPAAVGSRHKDVDVSAIRGIHVSCSALEHTALNTFAVATR